MKNIILFVLVVITLPAFAQTKIGSVILPSTFEVGKDQLILNGGGIREKFWMSMYVGGLYLIKKNENASEIISADTPMAIKIHIVSSLITSSRMRDAVEEGFKKSTGGNTLPFKEKIELFKKSFSDPIKVDDVFDIVYANGKITIYKNNMKKADSEGFDFKKAVFGIWLGDKPADDDLKKGMLSKK